VLRTAVDFRDGLERIWDETCAGQDNALARWKQYCDEARCSNICALREFAERLPKYQSINWCRTPRR
jgi:hypothetical protein